MWREKKNRSAVPLEPERVPPPPPPRQEMPMNEMTTRVPSTMASSSRQTVLGSTVVLRGELTASEDLTIEGQFEGTISLEEHCLTVGADGQVKAEIRAAQVVILGTVTGKLWRGKRSRSDAAGAQWVTWWQVRWPSRKAPISRAALISFAKRFRRLPEAHLHGARARSTQQCSPFGSGAGSCHPCQAPLPGHL